MNSEQLERAIEESEVTQVDFLPIVRDYMQRLGLVELINGMIVTEMDVEPGVIVAGMIQDTLSGRSPLYRLEDFFQTRDSELLLGQDVPPEAFRDHNVGRVMDRIYEVGTSRIFSEISRRAAVVFDIDTKCGHWDSTSVNVWGDYDVYDDNNDKDSRIKITNGYSKDKRPDLKQFLISMLCVEHNIPLLGDCQDGNASDKKLNNKLLTSISKSLSKHGINEDAFTYVADSAFVTEENLACFHNDAGDDSPTLYFVTRLPFSYNEADRIVSEAVEANQWIDIGKINQTPATPKRPAAYYKAYEGEVTLYDHTYRAVVLHSSAHDKRRQKRIDRELSADYKTLQTKLQASSRLSFHCRADAEAELTRRQAEPSTYYSIAGHVEEKFIYNRGRPSKTKPRSIRATRYQIAGKINEKEEVVAKKRQEAGCFVLLTNRPKTGDAGQNSEQVLVSYKGQTGIEQNFRFLKDPLIVNALFLKKPERIESLGMILLICLLLWNLMERSMRLYVKDQETTLAGWDGKETDRPTSFMMATKFLSIFIILILGKRVLKPTLNPVQRKYLKALGVDETVFVDPKPG